MKFQPLIAWWLIAPYMLAAVGVSAWQFWNMHRKKKAIILKWLRRSAILLLPGLIAMGPSVQGGTSSPGVTNLDVVIAVDTTPSMGALDYDGTQQRIDGVKKDLLALADSLHGAHLEIISFDSGASVILPLTTDATAFASAVDGIEPQINSYSQGSSIDKPIDLITQELKASETAFPEHYRLLFYLGDGEQTADTPSKSFASIAKYVDGGAVMGYGTPKGARMIKNTGINNPGAKPAYITTIDTATNQLVPAISNTNPAALQKIATQLKVSYTDRNQGGPVSDLYQISKAALAVDRSQRVIHYLNLYWLLAVPFAGLVFWEWQILVVKLLELREHHKKHFGDRHAQ